MRNLYRKITIMRTLKIALFCMTLVLSFLFVGWNARADTPSAPNTFSGVLTDQNGVALSGVTVALLNSTGGTVVHGNTTITGTFNLSAQPGTYKLSLNSSNLNGMAFTTQQAGMGIDISTGSLVQNLSLPIVSVGVAAYNAQGYGAGGDYIREDSQAGSTSLYGGDTGDTVYVSNATVITGTFKSVVGAVYASGSICADWDNDVYHQIGCNPTTYTVTSGANHVDVPNTPAPRNTFSGVLMDQNGNPLVGVHLTLTDAYGNSVTGNAGSGGVFSLAVEPGHYALSLSGTNFDNMDFSLSEASGTYGLDLTSGNLSQNLVLPLVTVHFVNVLAPGGATVANAISGGSGLSPFSLYSGEVGTDIMSVSNHYTLSSNFITILGMQYSNGICVYQSDGAADGCSQGFTASNGMTVAAPGPSAPYSLSTTTQNSILTLNWGALSGSTSFTVYRDGNAIANVSGALHKYVDNNVSPGQHSYSVSGSDDAGDTSGQSPAITANATLIAPLLGTPTLSATTVPSGQTVTVSAPITSNLYGMTGGEYYIGDTDPGQGSATPMTYSNGSISADIPTSSLGLQHINIRGNNGVGWGGTVSAVFNVIPASPANLSATSPTSEPILSWDGVPGATSYNIYRDGSKIATTTDSTYVDSYVAGGSHTYYVAAVDGAGDEGGQSMPLDVAVVLTAPVLGLPSFSANPAIMQQPTTIQVPVEGNQYGMTDGEYYAGSTDPGVGHGTLMTYSNGVLSGTFTPGVTTSDQLINIRAENSVGWGGAVTATLHVRAPIFSGTLTDQDGNPIFNVVFISLMDSTGAHFGTAYVGSDGKFSISMKPGEYALYVGGDDYQNMDFSISQDPATPGIDLTHGDLTQNLVIPLATVNYSTNIYINGTYSGNDSYGHISVQPTGSDVISLYPGDPGETGGAANHYAILASYGGTGSFVGIAGTQYVNGICDAEPYDELHTLECVPSVTLVEGVNTINI